MHLIIRNGMYQIFMAPITGDGQEHTSNHLVWSGDVSFWITSLIWCGEKCCLSGRYCSWKELCLGAVSFPSVSAPRNHPLKELSLSSGWRRDCDSQHLHACPHLIESADVTASPALAAVSAAKGCAKESGVSLNTSLDSFDKTLIQDHGVKVRNNPWYFQ